ncbi:conserved hypothetical protein [Verrucomicrobia bacterium]|nr:conserved hypothetical protein [Verrucomicrobiota bacterium]
MENSHGRYYSILAKLWLAGLIATAVCGRAQTFTPESAGTRLGISANEDGTFYQAEGFVDWNLPWAWDLGKEWRLQTRVDLSAGWLGYNQHDAFIGTAGPLLALKLGRWPLSVEGGSNPTLLSRQNFGSKNFGTSVQFTSHLGLYWDFAPHFRVGYRFQHMSNADLASPNPGLNLHVLALSYLF